jgi:steroid 5-alpha reductase family enzyme
MVFPSEQFEPTAEMFYYPVVALFAGNILLYIFVNNPCFGKRDNSWIDVMWSLSFCTPNIVIMIMRAVSDDPAAKITTRMLIASIPVFAWGLRLSSYIWIRHTREDYRYQQMREDWDKGGKCSYYVKSFVYVYLMQGLFSLVNNASALYVNLYSTGDSLAWTDFVGLAIWFVGFAIEVASDSQLASHLKNPLPGTGKFIKSGLWRYSRHPNYFGEAMLWWGIYLIACGIDYGWVTFFSSLFISLLIRFVSGVPFPEKKYEKNTEWIQYCAETNVFCLWFAKKDAIVYDGKS